MSDKLDLCEAEGEAARVLNRFSFAELPICPFTIAQRVGIVVQPKESSEPGVSGFLLRVGDTFGIQYASHITNDGFIRFTVAHELGHYFLPDHASHLFPQGDGTHSSHSGFVSIDRYERQADYFASALLMPEQRFRSELLRAGEGLEAIEHLAMMFRTSLTATAINFARFADTPVAIVVSNGRQIEYCFMSDRLRELPRIVWIKKGDFLTKSTTTYKFNANIATDKKAKKADGSCTLDDWFDDAPEIEMSEEVVRLGSYDKTLTVLYTDQDLEDELENELEDSDL